jgi:ABC-type bacteriocin/lantibiotic exporter with double-glycine peptidase domain
VGIDMPKRVLGVGYVIETKGKKVNEKDTNHFRKEEEGDCGENATESVLGMYGKREKLDINTKEGTSTKMIMKTLRDRGIQARARYGVAYDSIKPRSIVYYPRDDHYVAVDRVKRDKILVNDSSADKPKWLGRKEFIKKWQRGK